MTRKQLVDIEKKDALIEALMSSSIHFPLSQFPHLLSGGITFPVPVFAVAGVLEDVFIMEKFRTREYSVNNLYVLDEVTTHLVEVGGLKLRLFGLGGGFVWRKLCEWFWGVAEADDAGEGHANIAGGEGTMWNHAFQLAELLETGQRVRPRLESWGSSTTLPKPVY
jgi:hypothetical protein